jgi:hypothetical protein
VAGVFIVVGIALIGFGASMRSRVTYHRIDRDEDSE